MAFWGLEVKPGKAPTPLNIERRLVIKQAALVVKAAKKSEPCVLSVRCSLRARAAPEGGGGAQAGRGRALVGGVLTRSRALGCR